MATFNELLEEATPCALDIVNTVQERTEGPIVALMAIEVAKRSLLQLASEVPEVHAQWREIQKRLDGLSFSMHSITELVRSGIVKPEKEDLN